MPKWHETAGFRRWYSKFLQNATEEQKEFVSAIHEMAMAHYVEGGDLIVETFTPEEVIKEFFLPAAEKVQKGPAPSDRSNILRIGKKMAQDFCGLKVEQATNFRWGEDSDPELEREKKFRNSGEW